MCPLIREISRLGAGHRQALQLHLLSLNAHDRYQRFGMHLDDARLLAWLRDTDWEQQQWWGAWAVGDMGLLGAMQLVQTHVSGVWEMGLSVSDLVRQQGVARNLLSTVLLGGYLPELKKMVCLHGHPAVFRIAKNLGHTATIQSSEPRLWIEVRATAAFKA